MGLAAEDVTPEKEVQTRRSESLHIAKQVLQLENKVHYVVSFSVGDSERTFLSYWEYLVLIRKIIMLALAIVAQANPMSGLSATVLTLCFFTWLHTRYQPYRDEDLNKVETALLIGQCLLVTTVLLIETMVGNSPNFQWGLARLNEVLALGTIVFCAFTSMKLHPLENPPKPCPHIERCVGRTWANPSQPRSFVQHGNPPGLASLGVSCRSICKAGPSG